MAHLDLVALREPVTCRLPLDPEGTRRTIRQFRLAEIERYRAAADALNAGDEGAAIEAFLDLVRYAVDGITDADLGSLGLQDVLRILAAAQNKTELVEAALKNGLSGGGDAPPTASPDSTTTTPDSPPSPG